MAINSKAFGRVTLTEADAKKFRNQVTFGKPKAAAAESVKRGIDMVHKLRAGDGKITLTLKRG